MFVKWRAKRLAKPSLRLRSLNLGFEQLAASLAPVQARTEASEWVGCVDHVFEDNDYKLIASVDSGIVVAYVHDTDIYRATQPQVVRKLTEFLDFYGAEGTEHELDFMLDNGFGLLYRSKNSRVRAAYSYVADIFSVSLSRLERAEADEQAPRENVASDYKFEYVSSSIVRNEPYEFALIYSDALGEVHFGGYESGHESGGKLHLLSEEDWNELYPARKGQRNLLKRRLIEYAREHNYLGFIERSLREQR